MIAIALLLFVISFSMIITRSAAVMLELTGMSRDSARFQSRAAYCGVGYSNQESEGIINHPLRRRIISSLMLLGNAGTATVIATLILSFTGEEAHLYFKLGLLVLGLVSLYFIATSEWIDAKMTAFVQWAAKKYTRLDLSDYVALLNLSAGYSVLEVEVKQGGWLGGSDLAKLKLPMEGVLVLGVRQPDGTYIGVPPGNTRLSDGDMLTVYGKLDRLEELNHRQIGVAGLYAHEAAVTERAREAQPQADPATQIDDDQ